MNGSLEARLPGNLHVSFPGVDGEALMMSLADDVAVSSGAACTAAEPSHVMKALGRPTELAWRRCDSAWAVDDRAGSRRGDRSRRREVVTRLAGDVARDPRLSARLSRSW